MLLVVDVGNTNVVFALFKGDSLLGEWRCETNPKRTADEYGVWLTSLLALKDVKPAEIKGFTIGTVVPNVTANLLMLAKIYFDIEPIVLGKNGKLVPIDVQIDAPEQAGVDRLINAYEVFQRLGSAAIVLDFGTATTFDLVGTNGAYLGGALAPGVNLSVEAFYMAAARLPRIEIEPTEKVIGKATIPAMQSGVFWGYVGLIEGLIKRIWSEYETEFGVTEQKPVIATGGLAALFAGATPLINEIDPQLTLRGIKRVHDHLKSKGLTP